MFEVGLLAVKCEWCVLGGLNSADLSGFICSDERVTLRETTSGIYSLQGLQGFYVSLPLCYDHAVDCGIFFTLMLP